MEGYRAYLEMPLNCRFSHRSWKVQHRSPQPARTAASKAGSPSPPQALTPQQLHLLPLKAGHLPDHFLVSYGWKKFLPIKKSILFHFPLVTYVDNKKGETKLNTKDEMIRALQNIYRGVTNNKHIYHFQCTKVKTKAALESCEALINYSPLHEFA